LARANCFHEAINGVSRKWTAALGLEDKGPRRIALQFAQHAQLVAADGMHCGLAVLRPADVQRRIAALRKFTPITGSIRRHGGGLPPFLALSGGGQPCLLFIVCLSFDGSKCARFGQHADIDFAAVIGGDRVQLAIAHANASIYLRIL
jgi:hypothetical protein